LLSSNSTCTACAPVIDEKMWDEEDDKEEDENGKGKEQGQDKYEKGSAMQKDDDQETVGAVQLESSCEPSLWFI
jgi:hypothetical protein